MNIVRQRVLAVAVLLATSAGFARSAAAAVPTQITHQGRLFGENDQPINDVLTVKFALYDAADVAVPIWRESYALSFEDGYFSQVLEFDAAAAALLFEGSVRYLGITVGDDPEMAPRAAVGSVPYALVSNNAVGDITPASVSIPGVGVVIDEDGAVTPTSVIIPGVGVVIDENGHWVGSTSGLVGPAGPVGPPGATGSIGPQGAPGPTGPVGPEGPAGAQGALGPMGPQGPIGPVGPQGDVGATGPIGATGPQGPTGPSGVLATAPLTGVVAATIIGNSGTYVFVGPPVSVTTQAGQRVTGSASAPLGLALTASAQNADLGLCYQPGAGGPLTNFFAGNFSTHYFTATRVTYTVSGTAAPAAGTWNVGMCVRNNGPSPIVGNHPTAGISMVNGWFVVTNDG